MTQAVETFVLADFVPTVDPGIAEAALNPLPVGTILLGARVEVTEGFTGDGAVMGSIGWPGVDATLREGDGLIQADLAVPGEYSANIEILHLNVVPLPLKVMLTSQTDWSLVTQGALTVTLQYLSDESVAPATVLTLAEVREHVETDLEDPALQRLLNDADSAIVSRFGAHASAGVTERHPGYVSDVFPHRPVATVTAITERIGSTDLILDPTDFEVRLGGHQLRRLTTGVNQRGTWGGEVILEYVPVDDAARRKRIAIDLVKLALRYEAVKSETAGDYATTNVEYQDERNAILDELAPAFDFA